MSKKPTKENPIWEARKCQQCRKKFMARTCYTKRGQMKFCSHKCSSQHRSVPLMDRLLAGIKKTPSGCWEWIKSKHDYGYGQCYCPKRKRAEKTHVLFYEVFIGDIPSGLCVCHSCDNPPCCNPKHLWVGTQSENLKDMTKKGRRKNQFSAGV